MSEMIKQLQEIECPFGILKEKHPELIEELKKEKYRGFVNISASSGNWVTVGKPSWNLGLTYRLSPEYKEPETGQYKVFDVEPVSCQLYYADTPFGSKSYDELPKLKGFSGVQFEGQTNKIWYTVLNKYINEDGLHCEVATLQNLQDGKLKPAVPVRVLFWVEGE